MTLLNWNKILKIWNWDKVTSPKVSHLYICTLFSMKCGRKSSSNLGVIKRIFQRIDILLRYPPDSTEVAWLSTIQNGKSESMNQYHPISYKHINIVHIKLAITSPTVYNINPLLQNPLSTSGIYVSGVIRTNCSRVEEERIEKEGRKVEIGSKDFYAIFRTSCRKHLHIETHSRKCPFVSCGSWT